VRSRHWVAITLCGLLLIQEDVETEGFLRSLGVARLSVVALLRDVIFPDVNAGRYASDALETLSFWVLRYLNVFAIGQVRDRLAWVKSTIRRTIEDINSIDL
jgi:hypothetical protein